MYGMSNAEHFIYDNTKTIKYDWLKREHKKIELERLDNFIDIKIKNILNKHILFSLKDKIIIIIILLLLFNLFLNN